VENGVLRYTSVTGMALFEACPTKYYFRYVLGRPGDESPALDFGGAAHERLEKYQKGEPVVLGPCESQIVQFLPVPPGAADPGLVEQPLHAGAPLMLGSIPMVGWADRIQVGVMEAMCTDWKFKSNVAKWAATPRALGNHRDQDGRQMLAAAKWVTQNFPTVERVTVRHVTSQTGGIDAAGAPLGPFLAKETRGVPMSRAVIESRWAEVVAQFEQPLRDVVAAGDVSHVAGNLKNCFKYGRPCPYIQECPHKQENTMTTLAPPVGNPPTAALANPPSVDEPAFTTLYFGGSYPMFAKALTLHGFVAIVEEAVLRALLGEKYQPDMHMDVRAIKHPSLDFGKWKGELSSMAKKMLPRLSPGHYLVTNEEKMQVVADALLPRVNGVGGSR
jgi:hypothetical protein